MITIDHRNKSIYLTGISSTFLVTRAQKDIVNGFASSSRSKPSLTPLVGNYLKTFSYIFFVVVNSRIELMYKCNFFDIVNGVCVCVFIATYFDINFLKNWWRRSLTVSGSTPTSDRCCTSRKFEILRWQADRYDMLFERHRSR